MRPARRRRATGLRLLAVGAALALGGCSDDAGDPGGAPQPATPNTGSALDTVQQGKLTACTDVPAVPFEFEQEGQLDGIDIELVRALAGRLALAADFKALEADALFAALDAGECDLVASSVPITEASLETVDFSESYFDVSQSLLVRKGEETAYDDLAGLGGKRIGVRSASAGARFARDNAAGADIREFAAPEELFAALESRQVEAVLQDQPVNAHHATSTGKTVVSKVFTEAEPVRYGLAVKKGSAALKQAIDGALAQVRADDTYPTILRRFLGDTAGQI